MVQTIYKNWLPCGQHRRKRVLNKIRGQIERNGYSLEDIDDSDLEASYHLRWPPDREGNSDDRQEDPLDPPASLRGREQFRR